MASGILILPLLRTSETALSALAWLLGAAASLSLVVSLITAFVIIALAPLLALAVSCCAWSPQLLCLSDVGPSTPPAASLRR